MSEPRMMEIVTPLAADVLLFHGMTGWETMNRGFEFRVELLSTKDDVSPDGILGANVTIKLVLRGDAVRYFNGFVSRFSHGGQRGKYFRYVAIVRPWTWFLTRTADCRIFQELTVPDILKQVFNDNGMSDYKFELTGSFKKWTYCVQYRETDFNFVSRLMEEEGIAYYFRHTEGHNTLVLTNSTSKHKAVKDCEELSYIPPGETKRDDLEHVSLWSSAREVQTGVYVHDDYNFEVPSTELKTTKSQVFDKPSKYEVYDYPGHYAVKPDGETYAAVRIDELGTHYQTAFGTTNARGLTPGALLKLKDHPRKDQIGEYLITSANYELSFQDYETTLPDSRGSSYSCAFAVIPSKHQYRPARTTPKPFVQGPQTAVVTGPAGEEIHTDKYGRVKVQFHWDRLGKKDENSSCWVRVSSPWAGKVWGGISIPRMGQEVVVSFLEGDPDQPIITGRVYNAEQMPPYALPENKTQSGLVTRSSPGGTPDNFNELMFEDKKGSELVYLRAEKDYTNTVENDETRWVGHDRWTEVDHDETNHIYHDRTETVDNDETITIHGNRTEVVDKDETITIHQSRSETVDKDETITIAGNRTESVAKGETVSIGKDRNESVGENESISISKNQSVSVGQNRTLSVAKDESISVTGKRTDQVGKDEEHGVTKNRTTNIGENDSLKVGKNFLVDAGESITIKTGSASITMKKDGTISIKGKDLTIEGTGKINIKASSDVTIKGSKVNQN